MKTILFAESYEVAMLTKMLMVFADYKDNKPMARQFGVVLNRLELKPCIGNNRLALEFNAYLLASLFETELWKKSDDDARESLINMVFELARVMSCIWGLMSLDDLDFNLITSQYIPFFLSEFNLTDSFLTNNN